MTYFEDLQFVQHQIEMEIVAEQTEIDMTNFLRDEGLGDPDEEKDEMIVTHAQDRLRDLYKARHILEAWMKEYLKNPLP